MPEFLCLTGLAIPGNHHLDVGLVYEGEYEGTAVEIKVLYNARNISNVVRHPHTPILSNPFPQFRFKNRIFSEQR